MKSLHQSSSNIAITVNAANKLSELKQQYKKHLKFHLFLNDSKQLTLRIHDKVYQDDWIVEINGVGISFSTSLISYFENMVLDCELTASENDAFEFKLFVSDVVVSSLNGKDAIERIESEEIEKCDAYGEFCYTTYS